MCSGRLLDRKNKFTEAATRFLDLSKKMGYGETVLGTDKKEALASALANVSKSVKISEIERSREDVGRADVLKNM